MGIGTHILLDIYGMEPNILDDQIYIEKLLLNAAKEAKCKVLSYRSYKFEPQGLTTLILLAESHLAYHSYSELGFASIDIYTCGTKAAPDKALEYILKELSPPAFEKEVIVRGNRI